MTRGKYTRTELHRSILKGRKRPDMTGENNPAKRKEVRLKISANCGGKPLSAEHKYKLRLAKLGTTVSDTTKIKLRKKRQHQVFPTIDSTIEITLQHALLQADVIFTKHAPLLGQPDIFIQPNICIFADGCYWHKCKQCGYTATSTRDSDVTARLEKEGYVVLRFWEHEITNNVQHCVNRVLDITKPA